MKSTGNPLKDLRRDVESLFGKKERRVVKVQRTAPQTKTRKISGKPPKPRDIAAAATLASVAGNGAAGGPVDEYGLQARDRKALNAKVAAPAIANKIRNQNWNGISGEYAKADLMFRTAAAYDTGDFSKLSEYDIAALESFGIDVSDFERTDYQDYADDNITGSDGYPAEMSFTVETDPVTGHPVVTCNCAEVPDSPDLVVLVNDDGTPITDSDGNPFIYTSEEVYGTDDTDGFVDEAQAEIDNVKAMDDETAAPSLSNLEEVYDHAEDTLLGRSGYDGDADEAWRYLEGPKDHFNTFVEEDHQIERSEEFSDYPVPIDEELPVEGEIEEAALVSE